MPPSSPNAKRRRLNHASTALSKPFKSPLRRPTAPTQTNTPKEEEEKKNNNTTPPQSNPQSSKINPGNTDNTPTPTQTQTPTPATKPPPLSKSKSISNSISQPRGKTNLQPDPHLQSLTAHHRTLQTRLHTLRAELDTVTQALRLETSGRDEELTALIGKWRVVSQNAAEEVFVGARERICRMGGVKAWREGMRREREWERERDTEEFDEGEDGRGEEEKGEEEKEGEEEESEEFTMDMMLKTLNVDLKVIGYDRVNQRWVRE